MTKGSDRLILACQRAIYSSRFFFYFAQSGGNNTLNKKFLSYLLFKFSTENVIILYTLDIESFESSANLPYLSKSRGHRSLDRQLYYLR